MKLLSLSLCLLLLVSCSKQNNQDQIQPEGTAVLTKAQLDELSLTSATQVTFGSSSYSRIYEDFARKAPSKISKATSANIIFNVTGTNGGVADMLLTKNTANRIEYIVSVKKSGVENLYIMVGTPQRGIADAPISMMAVSLYDVNGNEITGGSGSAKNDIAACLQRLRRDTCGSSDWATLGCIGVTVLCPECFVLAGTAGLILCAAGY